MLIIVAVTVTNLKFLEQGDIYFFYRPKKDAEEVKGIEDVRRFFMVTAPEKSENTKENSNKNQFYRLFVIGKKSLPEIRKSEARASERYWARVGGIFNDPDELTLKHVDLIASLCAKRHSGRSF